MIPALAAAWSFAKSPLGRVLLLALAAVLLVVGFAAHERHIGRHAVLAAQEQARAEAAAKDAAAQAVADRRRAADASETATLERDLTHAYAATPDTRPSAARLRLACERLRRQHADLAKLPACAGPAPGT